MVSGYTGVISDFGRRSKVTDSTSLSHPAAM